jgi:hypothetical protein
MRIYFVESTLLTGREVKPSGPLTRGLKVPDAEEPAIFYYNEQQNQWKEYAAGEYENVGVAAVKQVRKRFLTWRTSLPTTMAA